MANILDGIRCADENMHQDQLYVGRRAGTSMCVRQETGAESGQQPAAVKAATRAVYVVNGASPVSTN
ncbi:hypothetical protein FJT64_019171 [Amphibalanus amphitrite]|uniref:Uncharacterized protein n=1 Tax=Amphibalanus amphitrite TaxID=1232801 RepID=A0A6A4WUU9_AMPAM|nr:hypothetical protein FJT64_019171 [Amphibalanus amphitrite]